MKELFAGSKRELDNFLSSVEERVSNTRTQRNIGLLLVVLALVFDWFVELEGIADVALTLGFVILTIFVIDRHIEYAEARGVKRGISKFVDLMNKVAMESLMEMMSECKVHVRKHDSAPEIDFKKARTERGMTQAQLSKKTKVPVHAISQIEKDWKKGKIKHVETLSKFFGFSA